MTKKSIMQQNYPLAPIIEAVIDIRVLPAKDIDFSKFDQAVREKFLKEYPHVAKQFQNEFRLQGGEYPQANPITSNVGLRFTSEDNKEILQIKENGFTFSKLAPYENWEKYRAKAKHLWTIYQKATLPQHINRIAVRFINRFDFPGTSIELSDYLNVFPQLPERNLMKGFSMQAILNQAEINSTLIITQALVPSNKPDTVSILLDFDLFNEELRLPEDDFWLYLEQLRIRKNQIFENSITEKTRELIS
jgi:uncharacterized protein (TIGR04255 family)